MKKKLNKFRKLDPVIISISIIVLIVVLYSVYIFSREINYTEKLSIYITIIAGGIGGVGTLIAVFFTNNETRRIQEEIKLKSNIEKDIEEIDRYIEECKQLIYSIEALFTMIGFLSTTIASYYGGKISETELDNKFLSCQKEITSVRLNLFILKIDDVKHIMDGINLIYKYLNKTVLFINKEGVETPIYSETCMYIAQELVSYANVKLIQLIQDSYISRGKLYEQKSLL